MKILFLTFALALAACSGSSSPSPSSPLPPPSSEGSGSAEPTQQAGACIKTGCGGTVCADPGNDMMTTCEFKPEHACYRTATCEKQADGKCAWTQSPQLTSCLASPPAP